MAGGAIYPYRHRRGATPGGPWGGAEEYAWCVRGDARTGVQGRRCNGIVEVELSAGLNTPARETRAGSGSHPRGRGVLRQPNLPTPVASPKCCPLQRVQATGRTAGDILPQGRENQTCAVHHYQPVAIEPQHGSGLVAAIPGDGGETSRVRLIGKPTRSTPIQSTDRRLSDSRDEQPQRKSRGR